jgi:hypothetical protein
MPGMTLREIGRFKDDYPAVFALLIALSFGVFVLLPCGACALWVLYKFIEIFVMN